MPRPAFAPGERRWEDVGVDVDEGVDVGGDVDVDVDEDVDEDVDDAVDEDVAVFGSCTLSVHLLKTLPLQDLPPPSKTPHHQSCPPHQNSDAARAGPNPHQSYSSSTQAHSPHFS